MTVTADEDLQLDCRLQGSTCVAVCRAEAVVSAYTKSQGVIGRDRLTLQMQDGGAGDVHDLQFVAGGYLVNAFTSCYLCAAFPLHRATVGDWRRAMYTATA